MKRKLIILGLISVITISGLTGCKAIDRGLKDVKSSMSGLDRIVTVMDHTGEIITTYEGIIDLKTSESDSVKFDLNGKRIIIKNAIVLIEEK